MYANVGDGTLEWCVRASISRNCCRCLVLRWSDPALLASLGRKRRQHAWGARPASAEESIATTSHLPSRYRNAQSHPIPSPPLTLHTTDPNKNKHRPEVAARRRRASLKFHIAALPLFVVTAGHE